MNDTEPWPTRALSAIATTITSGATPQSGSSRYYTTDEGLPFAKIDDLTASTGQCIDSTILHVTDSALKEIALKAYPVGTILLSMYGTIGLVKITARPMCANQALAALIPPFNCDPKFLYHVLVSLRPAWEKFKAQTTQANINGAIVKAFRIPEPPMAQQRRIAEILDALDEQIRINEQMIAKLALTNQAMTVDLLTRGIDAKGLMRDADYSIDSAAGPVPPIWEVAPLARFQSPERAYLKTGPFGSSLKQEHWVEEGVPVVTIGSLGDGRFIESDLLHITGQTARSLSAYALEPGDIVFSRVADVGRSVVVGDSERGWIMSSNMMWISLDQKRVDPGFVRANIANNSNIRRQIRRYVNSAGRDVANAQIMNLLQFPWPSLEEQKAIVARITVAKDEVVAQQAEVAKLRILKQGLMADLLTGRVRTPAEIES
jgi:type I restriction enzyme, S subunit